MTHRFKLLIFDHDGTLVNEQRDLFPLVKETLIDLKTEETFLAVATAQSLKSLLRKLKINGLNSVFDNLQTLDTSPNKPSPEMILSAMSDLNVSPKDTLMIGDTVSDILMAQNACVPCIGIYAGLSQKMALEQAGAQKAISSVCELPSLLPLL